MSIDKNICTVLINYNSDIDTVKCLKTLQESTLVPKVILIDNASKTPIDQAKIDFYPDIHLIHNAENVGFGRANNIGIEWAMKNTQADYFFILNNDTLVEKNTNEVLIKNFSVDPQIGMTTCLIEFVEPKSEIWYGGGEWDNRKGRPKVIRTKPLANQSRYVSFVSGCAMMIKREVIEKVGAFDKRFFMYIEDVEYCKRIIDAGFKLYYTTETKIVHVVNGSSSNNAAKGLNPKNPNLAFQAYHKFKNTLLTMGMHLPTKDFLKFRIYYSFFTAYKVLQFTLAGRFDALKAIRKAYVDYGKEK